jgi:hypothetical protein
VTPREDTRTALVEGRKTRYRALAGVSAPQERFPEAEIGGKGNLAIWHGQKSWDGAANRANLTVELQCSPNTL